jgi:hypothetical protein
VCDGTRGTFKKKLAGRLAGCQTPVNMPPHHDTYYGSTCIALHGIVALHRSAFASHRSLSLSFFSACVQSSKEEKANSVPTCSKRRKKAFVIDVQHVSRIVKNLIVPSHVYCSKYPAISSPRQILFLARDGFWFVSETNTHTTNSTPADHIMETVH